MHGLTKRQSEILEYVQEFIAHNRYSPSYREIGQHFGFSSLGSVYKHILALKRKGVILSDTQTSRSLAPVVQTMPKNLQQLIEVPFIGQIAAGYPIQTFPQAQHIAVPAAWVHAVDKTYALRVQGEGLGEEMLADGDVLLVEARQEAHPGETVVALINDHDTIVKKYYPEGDYVRLMGAYSHHHPIILRSIDVMVQGILIGLVRLFG